MKLIRQHFLRALAVTAMALLVGCRPSLAERRAEALLLSATEKEATPGQKNLYQAFSLYETIVREYDGTDAASHASRRIQALKPTITWMRALDARERAFDMQTARKRVMDAATSP